MKKLRLFTSAVSAALLPAAVAAMMSSGCSINDDTIDSQVSMTRYDVVTFESNGDDGTASFTLVGPDDTGSRSLRARAHIDTSYISPGDRMILAWAEVPGESDVAFRGATVIFNGRMQRLDARTLDRFRGDDIYLLSMWRTGPWLNVRARLSYTTSPRVWSLAVDSATLATECPRLRLMHRLPQGVSPDSTWMATVYSSFDISALTADPAVRSFTVEVDNSNVASLNKLTFNK